jgi:hypothetical protein
MWIILIAILLILASNRLESIEAKQRTMDGINIEDINTGDVWVGFFDWDKSGLINKHIKLYFDFLTIVSGCHFTHTGVIYRDPSKPRDDIRSLYVYTCKLDPWDGYVGQFPFGKKGTHLMPFEVCCAGYHYNMITPLKNPVDDYLFRQVMDKHQNAHEHFKSDFMSYMQINGTHWFTPWVDKDPNCIVCTDFVGLILTDCDVWDMNKCVVGPFDLWRWKDDATWPPFYLKFSPKHTFQPSRQVCIEMGSDNAAIVRKICELCDYDYDFVHPINSARFSKELRA